MIEFSNISKSYQVKSGRILFPTTQTITANSEISFHCETGQIHGLLGVNGAGKSTLLKMLCGLSKPDSGSITVDGVDVVKNPQQVQRKMGIFLNSDGLYPKLTARENIELYAALHRLDNIQQATDNILNELKMLAIAERRTEGFSTGQRMKVALARALVHQPKYVILDEPTRGLDVVSIRLLREYLLTLKQRGCCVLFSCHVMQEVEKISDQLTLIHDGQVCYQGNISALKQQTSDADLEQAFIQAVGA